MSKFPRLVSWLLVCGVLTACATGPHVVSEGEGCEASARALPFAEACEEDEILLAVCGAEACAVYRCREVAQELLSGQVVLTRGGGLTRPPNPNQNPAQRYWGSAQGLPKNAQPVFIIPWGPKPKQELLPSQEQQLEELKAQRTKVYEMHHIFPREFQLWFASKGIEIDLFTLPLEVEEHRRIHRGAQGGPWNAAWRDYIKNNRGALKADIFKHAGQLIYEFGLFGSVVPYRPRALQPPPIGGS
jgi:uncharacterized lipoprotein (TIGR02269 family)